MLGSGAIPYSNTDPPSTWRSKLPALRPVRVLALAWLAAFLQDKKLRKAASEIMPVLVDFLRPLHFRVFSSNDAAKLGGASKETHRRRISRFRLKRFSIVNWEAAAAAATTRPTGRTVERQRHRYVGLSIAAITYLLRNSSIREGNTRWSRRRKRQ